MIIILLKYITHESCGVPRESLVPKLYVNKRVERVGKKKITVSLPTAAHKHLSVNTQRERERASQTMRDAACATHEMCNATNKQQNSNKHTSV